MEVQAFGQNQRITDSNNAQAGQTASNEQQNTDTNTALGTSPTSQNILGDNRGLTQTQSIAKSGGGSNTQDTVTNAMQNLNDSPHNSATTQNNLFGSQSIEHQQTIDKSPNSQNTLKESNQQLNTNHQDSANGVNQLLLLASQSQKFNQNINNSPNSHNDFNKDHIIRNLHQQLR